MYLCQLEKEFYNIAVRYESKDYLTSTYRNYFIDGYCHINNSTIKQKPINIFFVDHIQKVSDIYSKSPFKYTEDLEIKAFLIHMKEFARKNQLSKVELSIIDGRLVVYTYREVQVEFEDKMPF